MKNLVSLLSKIILLVGVATFILAPTHQSAFAQETGQISGTVSDPTSAVVPNAAVTITNLGTNA
ncbi:MAG TPA: carboxypeptidase-like regulatory domain-containing protein, partial [Bryobacteraceae bacterium]